MSEMALTLSDELIQVVGHSSSRMELAKKVLANVGGYGKLQGFVDVEGSECLLMPVPTVAVVELKALQGKKLVNKILELKSPLLILGYGVDHEDECVFFERRIAEARMGTEHKVPILFQKQSSTDPKGVEEMFEYFMSLVKSGASPVPYNANHQSDFFAVVNRKLSPFLQVGEAKNEFGEEGRWVYDAIASETSIGDVWFSNGKEGEWRPQSRVVVDMHVVHFTDLNKEYFDTVVCGEKQVLTRIVAVVGATKDDVRVLEEELREGNELMMVVNTKFLYPEDTKPVDLLKEFSPLDITDGTVSERVMVRSGSDARTLRGLLLERAGLCNSTVRLSGIRSKDAMLCFHTRYTYTFCDTFRVGDTIMRGEQAFRVVKVNPLGDFVNVVDAEGEVFALFCRDPPSKLPFGLNYAWNGLTWAFSRKS